MKTMSDTKVETICNFHINAIMIKPQETLLCYVSEKLMIMAAGVAILINQESPRVFYKIGVLKNFTKFTGRHLCQSFFFCGLLARNYFEEYLRKAASGY